MNKVPSRLLQKVFVENREYLPVALVGSQRRPSTIQKLPHSPRTSLTKQEVRRSSRSKAKDISPVSSFKKVVSGQGTAMALATVKPYNQVMIDANEAK